MAGNSPLKKKKTHSAIVFLTVALKTKNMGYSHIYSIVIYILKHQVQFFCETEQSFQLTSDI